MDFNWRRCACLCANRFGISFFWAPRMMRLWSREQSDLTRRWGLASGALNGERNKSARTSGSETVCVGCRKVRRPSAVRHATPLVPLSA